LGKDFFTYCTKKLYYYYEKQKVPDKVIMSYTGHTSLEVFNNYYRPSEEDKVNYMNEVLNNLRLTLWIKISYTEAGIFGKSEL
jgi:ABC-type multidrug transport system ATPase subunit